VRTVLFDVDGVLVHGYHARPELQVRWDETLFGVDPDRFKSEFIYDVFVKEVIVGKLGLIEAVERVLPGLGYTGSPMTFISYWLSRDSNLNRQLIDVIRRLRATGAARLYIATNQEHLRAQWLWQTVGLGEVFDDMFHSARIGALKPASEYFASVKDRIGPQHEPPLFFDDSEEVIRAARGEGWEAVLFSATADCTAHPWIAAQLAAA